MRTGPGRDGVDADLLLAEIPGEVLDGGVERRLRDAHHVVVRHRALAAEVGHRHDRAAARGRHQRLGRARGGDERVGADVDGHPEAVARRVGEAALEILGGRERDRVDEQVELAVPRLSHLAEDAVDVLVGADVAGRHQLRADRRGELAHVALDPLALECEGELGSLVRQPLRNRPCDRALVGDPHDQGALPGEPCHVPILRLLCRSCAASSDPSHSAWRSSPRRLLLLHFSRSSGATARSRSPASAPARSRFRTLIAAAASPSS